MLGQERGQPRPSSRHGTSADSTTRAPRRAGAESSRSRTRSSRWSRSHCIGPTPNRVWNAIWIERAERSLHRSMSASVTRPPMLAQTCSSSGSRSKVLAGRPVSRSASQSNASTDAQRPRIAGSQFTPFPCIASVRVVLVSRGRFLTPGAEHPRGDPLQGRFTNVEPEKRAGGRLRGDPFTRRNEEGVVRARPAVLATRGT